VFSAGRWSCVAGSPGACPFFAGSARHPEAQAGTSQPPEGPVYELLAVVVADAHGYSRAMARNELGTFGVMAGHTRLLSAAVATHGGRVTGGAGDSLLAAFPSVVRAVQAAVAIQEAVAARNLALPPDLRLEFRVGVDFGDVIVAGAEVFGRNVNLAARLQELAVPGGVAVSAAVRDQVRDRLPHPFRDGGLRRVKNLPEPLRVFHLAPSPDVRKVNRFQPVLRLLADVARWSLLAGAVTALAALGGAVL
jgi:class 3 adenylate cyclase